MKQSAAPAAGAVVTQVTALVDYLHRQAPETAAALRAKFPEAADSLTPGKWLGSGDEAFSTQQTMAFLELAREALGTARRQVDKSTDMLRARMRFAARFRLFGSFVAALSGAGMIGALIAEARILAFAGAAISFLSSLATLVAQYVEAPMYGENTGPQALFASLVPLKQQITECLQEVELAAQGRLHGLSALALVRQANKLVAELDGIEMKIGKP